MDTTVSGLDINAEGVAVHPASAAKVAIMRGVTTADFVIWSALGAAKTACAAPDLEADGTERDAARSFATAAANAEATPFVHTLSALPREAHEQLAAAGGEEAGSRGLEPGGDDRAVPLGAWRVASGRVGIPTEGRGGDPGVGAEGEEEVEAAPSEVDSASEGGGACSDEEGPLSTTAASTDHLAHGAG